MSDLISRLRYMGKQYSAGQYARGGGVQKHYLEEAADALEAQAKRLAELESRLAQAEVDAAKQFAAGMERAAGICDQYTHADWAAKAIRAAKDQK